MSSEPIKNCPACGETGETVKPITLESLLLGEAKSRVREVRYRFCDSSSCDTVYFPEDGSDSFLRSDMAVPVGIKETASPRHVCYCFDHTIEEIEGQVRETGNSDVLDDIKARMKEACWCETKSPQGRCCLGLVTRVIREARKNIRLESTPMETPSPVPSPPATAVGVAALIAAVAASACCWLPLGLAFAGVSGAAASTVIGEYRPLLLTLTFGLLAAAFYLSFRPVQASAGDCCGPETCSPVETTGPSRRSLWVLTGCVVALALFPAYSGSLTPERPPSMPLTSSNSWILGVDGMTCAGCEAHVQSALEELPGVHEVTASYDDSNARVIADPSVSQGDLEKAILSIGYQATMVTRLRVGDSGP